jgi:hypothetical protein
VTLVSESSDKTAIAKQFADSTKTLLYPFPQGELFPTPGEYAVMSREAHIYISPEEEEVCA